MHQNPLQHQMPGMQTTPAMALHTASMARQSASALRTRIVAAVLAAATVLFGAPAPAAAISGGIAVDTAASVNHWMASIVNTNTHGCSGVMIRPSWVLTTHACINRPYEPPTMVTAGGQTRAVVYYRGQPNGNLTLAKLEAPISTVGIMLLAEQEPAVDAYVQLYAGGAECETCHTRGSYRMATGVIATNTKVGTYDGPYLEYFPAIGQVQAGDQGGGLMRNGVLVGIQVSMRNLDLPGSTIAASIARNRIWILSTILAHQGPIGGGMVPGA